MKKPKNKETEKMKSKRPHWQHQGKDGVNSKGNVTISAIPDIDLMSDHITRRKEATEEKSTTTTTVTEKYNKKKRLTNI